MNFDQLKQEAQTGLADFAKSFSDAKRKLATFQKRAEDAKALLFRLERRKAELMGLASESVAEDVNSFEKFKVSLRKVNAEIEATRETLIVLDKIILGQRALVTECAKSLQAALPEFWRPHQQACEGEMRSLLDQVIRLRDAFEIAFIKTADDSGLSGSLFLGMHQIHGNILPIPAHPRFSTIFTQGKRPQDAKARQAVPAAPQAAQDEQTPVEPTDTLEQSEQTPVEPVADTPSEILETPELEAVVEPEFAKTMLTGEI